MTDKNLSEALALARRVQLAEEAPAMLAALRWALGALEKCPPPKEKRGNLDTVAARAWHGRARGDIQRIIARIDGAAPAPTAQPAGDTCQACGRASLDCSRAPCPTVVAERGEG